MRDNKQNCGFCNKHIPKHFRTIKCCKCIYFYHVRCSNTTLKEFKIIKENGNDWICKKCKPNISPVIKCGSCKKVILHNKKLVQCLKCSKFFHSKCGGISAQEFLRVRTWSCSECLRPSFPFNNIDNENLFFTMEAKDTLFSEHINMIPDFTIRTLLDKMPGEYGEQSDEFLSNAIFSKYYSPSEFLRAKIPKTSFSIFHLNIASLSLHLEDLNSLLNILDHPFDIIGISETRLREGFETLTDITLDGYEFVHTPTKTAAGGVGLFIKNGFDYEVKK